jgi:hypothetical protein
MPQGLAPQPGPWRTACSPAPTSARPSTPSTPRDRASFLCWQGWCGDCTFPPLPPDGRCAHAPFQSPRCDTAVVCAHLRAPDESLTRDVYPCFRKSPVGSRQTLIMPEVRPEGNRGILDRLGEWEVPDDFREQQELPNRSEVPFLNPHLLKLSDLTFWW